MKIKTKISSLFGLLLGTILLMGAFACITVYQQKVSTERILKDNYHSVTYAQQMLSATNIYYTDSVNSIKNFRENLALQKKNVTEQEERMMTERLESRFNAFLAQPTTTNMLQLHEAINTIIRLNTNAIYYKSEQASDSAKTALLWTILMALLCAGVATFMQIHFPKSLSSPIQKLIEGITEIANGHYGKRLEFAEDAEFALVATSFNHMTEQLALYEESNMARIIAAKQYLETVVRAINKPILGLNQQQEILFANTALSNLINLPEDKLVGQSALALSVNNDLLRRLVKGMPENGGSEKEPLKIYADNKESYFEVHYLKLADEYGTVVMLNDVTKFKELDNAKTNFISVISHELKTPISAILMSLQLLEDKRIGTLSDEQQELAKSIGDNSDRLLKITGELLKMTQVESGSLQLSPKVTKPIELIEYAIKATHVLAERFECNIEVEYPTEKMPKLFVDSEKIAWVITNLLGNAIHYSPQHGRIIIGARQTENRIEIYVRDFGKGIDPRYHDTIFERYFRVPGTKVQGSGLGLAISKDFVEAHGGNIRVESEIGKGSCFIVTLDSM